MKAVLVHLSHVTLPVFIIPTLDYVTALLPASLPRLETHRLDGIKASALLETYITKYLKPYLIPYTMHPLAQISALTVWCREINSMYIIVIGESFYRKGNAICIRVSIPKEGRGIKLDILGPQPVASC